MDRPTRPGLSCERLALLQYAGNPARIKRSQACSPAQERHCSVKMATNGSTDSFLKDMLVASVLVSCCGTWDRKI